MAGEVDATCTNALNKEALNKALEFYHGERSDGYTHFDGHTEIYATYTHTKKYTMMLVHMICGSFTFPPMFPCGKRVIVSKKTVCWM